MSQNFDALFCKEIEHIKSDSPFTAKRPALLLHVCCAPCSSAVLERLAGVFDVSVYFYNPNIHPKEEYCRRLTELESFLKKALSQDVYGACDIPLIKALYEPQDFFSAVQTELFPERKAESEKGRRCEECYRLRMTKTAHFAAENDYDYFTTALSISPHKDAKMINSIGMDLEQTLSPDSTQRVGGFSSSAPSLAHNSHYPRYLHADFKKRNGYKRSLELSKEFDLYRQDYCGCVFSQR